MDGDRGGDRGDGDRGDGPRGDGDRDDGDRGDGPRGDGPRGDLDPARTSRLDGLWPALAIAVLAVLPWLVRVWPAEEEPRRLAVAHALIVEDAPGSPYAGLVDPAARVDPIYAFMVAAGRLVGVDAAGRLACSIAIAALCLAQWLLLRRLAPARWRNLYLLLPLATGPLLLRGGTPIMLGLALGLTAIALVGPRLVDEARALDWRIGAAAAALLAVAGLTSPLGLLLCGAALVLLAGRRLVRPRAWPLPALLVVAALPALARALVVLRAASYRRPLWMHARLDERVGAMLGSGLATFSGWEGVLRRAPVLCLVAGALVAVRRRGPRGDGIDAAISRLVVGALLLALLMPGVAGLPPCAELAADALLWTACGLALSLPGRSRPALLGAAGLALAAALTLVQSRAMQGPAAALGDVLAAGRSIPRGSRVLPLRFAAPGAGAIDPLRHAWGHVAVERDIVTPFLAPAGGALLSCASPLPWPIARLPHLGEDAAARIQAIDPHRCAGVAEPAIDCGCEAWKAVRYAALLEAARSYDRLLVIAPPDDFLAAARGALVPLARAGDVQVFAPRAGAPAAPALLCEPEE